MSTAEPNEPVAEPEYDPFEEFNRSAGIGVVENPYPMFALIRAEHTIKQEDLGEAMVADAADVELLNSNMDESINVFTAFGFDAVQQVLKDGETFSSAGYADIMGPVFGHSILEMDEPEHHTLPRAGAAGVQPQGDGDVGARPGARRRRRVTRRDRRRQARRPRAQLDLPVPGARDRAHAGPAPRGPADVPPPSGRDDQRGLRVRPRDQRVERALRVLQRDHRRASAPSLRRRDLGPGAGRARRRAPRRRGDLLVPPAAASRRRRDHVPLVEQPPLRAAHQPRPARRAARRPRPHEPGDRGGAALGAAAARHHAHRDTRHRDRRHGRYRRARWSP